jgi:hypothetical protein
MTTAFETASESERISLPVSDYFGEIVCFPLFVAEAWQRGDATGGSWIKIEKYCTPNDLRLLVRYVDVEALTVVVDNHRADFQLSELGIA